MTTVKKWHDSTTSISVSRKGTDKGVFLCQSAADPGERKHDLDLRTGPQENPQRSQLFLDFLPLDPRIVQNCPGLTEALTNLGSRDLDSLARLTP